MPTSISSPQATAPDLRAIAYHEAGHVVVGTRLGLDVLGSDLYRDGEGGRGHTHFAPVSVHDRERVERVVTTFMAGFAAEVKLGSRDPEGSGYDVDLALREWLAYLESDPRLRSRLAQKFLAQARFELEKPGVWTAVESVASALLSEYQLDGARARSLASTQPSRGM